GCSTSKTRDAQRRIWKQSSGGPYRDFRHHLGERSFGSRLRPVRLFRVQMLTLCTASGSIAADVTVLPASQFSSNLLACTGSVWRTRSEKLTERPPSTESKIPTVE